MSKNKEIGHKGELIAIEYLAKAGYQIVCTNYRYARYEIDIIAIEDETLVFVEVKTRGSGRFGLPEEAIDDKKIDNILECANYYIENTQWLKRIRFDIISISLWPGLTVRHIKDAFF
ncbi:MAG: YraN family protein [Cyclobacteriaceae bacterium]|nr:YraN family protein [Cyclobacteriaceae bacterium]